MTQGFPLSPERNTSPYAPAMASRLRQAVKAHRHALPWVVVKRLLGSFLKVETLVVFERALTSCPPHFVPADPALRIVRVDSPEQAAFVRLSSMYPGKHFPARLQRPGQQCFIALHDDKVAGYAWVAATDLYLEEIACTYRVASGEIFIYDCFVEPEYRGCGIYPAMLAYVLAHAARNEQLTCATIAAAAENFASIRGIVKAGFAVRKRIRYVACCQKQKWWGLDALGQA